MLYLSESRDSSTVELFVQYVVGYSFVLTVIINITRLDFVEIVLRAADPSSVLRNLTDPPAARRGAEASGKARRR